MHKSTEKLLNKKGRKIASFRVIYVAKSNQCKLELDNLLILLTSSLVKI